MNGNNVTAYGLFVEHHQEFQVVWNGENGRTYFYQSEIPYDPPDQASYTSAPGVNGWASYKVADHVAHHEAWGLGVYSVFRHPNVVLTRAIEVPKKPTVRFHSMITVALDDKGRDLKHRRRRGRRDIDPTARDAEAHQLSVETLLPMEATIAGDRPRPPRP